MARAIWSGAISFGLVNIPVKLFSAVSRKTVRFHQLDGKTQTRIQQKRVNPETGDEVPYERIVKGYELSPERYVIIEPDELESVEPKKTRAIDIEDFVKLEQIDPIYYDHPYYLAPGTGAAKSYRLLLDALEESQRVAVARVVIRSKEQLVAIRPHGEVLMMETLLFGDEVVPPDRIDEIPDTDDVEVSDRELDMARQLIDSLAADFDPAAYRDEYRLRVLEMIEAKAEGEEIVVAEPEEEPQEVPDLMAALEASIASAKRQGGSGSSAKANGSKPKSKSKTKASPSGSKSKPAAKSKAKTGASKKKATAAKSGASSAAKDKSGSTRTRKTAAKK